MRIQAGTVLRDTVLHRLAADKVRYPFPWVLAISGGIDSMVLLHLLSATKDELGSPNLIVAAFDHQLRPNSALDRDFVEHVSTAMGLPFAGGVAHREYGNTSGENIEAVARQQRYDFLADVARQHHARVVFTAHHADDQVETILLHLIRGTGMGGLRGMAFESPVPGNADLVLVRPLLDIFREDIEQYAVQYGLIWREDETNTDVSYSRNRLRHSIIPLLRLINPSVNQAILRVSELLGTEDDFVRSIYRREVEPYLIVVSERVSIDLEVFRSLHDALQRRFLLDALVRLKAIEPQLRHIQAAQRIAQSGRHGQQSLFSGGFRLRIEYERLHVESDTAPYEELATAIESNAVLSVSVPGRTLLGKQHWLMLSHESSAGAVLLGNCETSQVMIRTRRPGDRFLPRSLNGHSQSLKKWFIERKIPQYQRDTVPLILMEDRVAGVILDGEIIPAHAGSLNARNKSVYAWIEPV